MEPNNNPTPTPAPQPEPAPQPAPAPEPSPAPQPQPGMPPQGPAGPAMPAPMGTNEKRYNKHVFVWVGAFLFGGLGVDRFMRGQIGIGIAKLLLAFFTLGIWPLIDWIIALTKVYGAPFGQDQEVVFIDGKYAK